MGRLLLTITAFVLLGCDPTDGRPGGEPCALHVQCESDLCTPATFGGRSTGFSGGMCTQPCDPDGLPCLDVGFQCVPFSTGSLCLPECSGVDDCREGYVCAGVGAARAVCFPDCRSGFACQTGLCDAATGQCVPPGDAWADVFVPDDVETTTGPGHTDPPFPPCTPDGACDDGRVCSGPDRTCHVRCGPTAPLCPASTGCGPTPLGPLCLPLCDDQRPCPDGMHCAPSPLPPPPGEARPLVCLKSPGGASPKFPTQSMQ